MRRSVCYLFPIKVGIVMFFVVDIAKNSHETAVINDSGTLIVKPFKFKNSLQGFDKLISALQALSSYWSDFEFGMEAIGHY